MDSKSGDCVGRSRLGSSARARDRSGVREAGPKGPSAEMEVAPEDYGGRR